MVKLIEAALEHARLLREGADAADDHGARATIEEAERWEVLASAARDELVRLGVHQYQWRKRRRFFLRIDDQVSSSGSCSASSASFSQAAACSNRRRLSFSDAVAARRRHSSAYFL
jgi:hypothetical protein